MKISRNDLCPCGSGKKYKKCCINNSEVTKSELNEKPKYEFNAGSYGGHGLYFASISCEKVTKIKREYHFVLVNQNVKYSNEDEAVEESEKDLEEAFQEFEKTGLEITVADVLKSKGYMNMEDFKIVK